MKKILWLTIPVFSLLFCSCASSERMLRMSGGVFGESSLPAPERVSRKQNIPAKMVDRKHVERVGTFQDSLINLWPFFYRNATYFSILWPMADYDQYGFAVRPFYNQEGDEYSVLFPLSAWNPVRKDGWVLNTWWSRNAYGSLPFFFRSGKDGQILLYYWTEHGKGLFPLAYLNHSFEKGYLLLGFWNQDSRGIVPLACVKKDWSSGWCLNTFWGKNYLTILPILYLNHKNQAGAVLNTFWKKDYYSAVFPFYLYLPKNDLFFSPLFWKSKEKFGVFPIYRQAPSGTKSVSYLFPLYFYNKDFFATPLFGIGYDEQRKMDFFSLFYILYMNRKQNPNNFMSGGKQIYQYDGTSKTKRPARILSSDQTNFLIGGFLCSKEILFAADPKRNPFPAVSFLENLKRNKYQDQKNKYWNGILKSFGISHTPKNDREYAEASRILREKMTVKKYESFGFFPFFFRETCGAYRQTNVLSSLLWHSEYKSPDNETWTLLSFVGVDHSLSTTENSFTGEQYKKDRWGTAILFNSEKEESRALRITTVPNSVFPPVQEPEQIHIYMNLLSNFRKSDRKRTDQIELYGKLFGIPADTTSLKTRKQAYSDLQKHFTTKEEKHEFSLFPFFISLKSMLGKFCLKETQVAPLLLSGRGKDEKGEYFFSFPLLSIKSTKWDRQAPVYTDVDLEEKQVRPFYSECFFLLLRLLYGSVSNSYLQWKPEAQDKRIQEAVHALGVLADHSLSMKTPAEFIRKANRTQELLAPILPVKKHLRDCTYFELKKLHAELLSEYTIVKTATRRGGVWFYGITRMDGNYMWDILFLLARGKKTGETENIRILEYLYRYSKEKDRENILIFPFISIQKDGQKIRRSFLWRLISVEYDGNQRTGGHILFFPFSSSER